MNSTMNNSRQLSKGSKVLSNIIHLGGKVVEPKEELVY